VGGDDAGDDDGQRAIAAAESYQERKRSKNAARVMKRNPENGESSFFSLFVESSKTNALSWLVLRSMCR
jgi:hypothetical protein